MDPIITVGHLSRSFRSYKKEPGVLGSLRSLYHRDFFDVHAVKDISFTINPGEAIGFIGPNGAGKTTTLKMLSGLLYPSAGQVSVLGYEPFQRKPEYLKKYALIMGQKSQLWWDLPPLEGFILNKEIYQVSDTSFNANIRYLADLLDVTSVLKIPVRKLSLGQRMKCELIAALIHNPQILFLDEPTIGLDVVVQKKIRAFLKTHNQEKKTTIILTSHNMDDVQEICKRIIIINHGSLIYDGPLADLTKQYAKNKVLKLIFNQPVTKTELKKYGTITHFEVGGLSATISVPRVKHTTIAGDILRDFSVDDLDIAETSLEDIIREIFETSLQPKP